MVTATQARYRRLALPLAVLVFMFCFAVAAPAVADDPTCGGFDPSGHVCAQPGTSTAVFAVATEPPAALTPDLPGVPVLPDVPSVEPFQHHADLATPRAPPSLT